MKRFASLILAAVVLALLSTLPARACGVAVASVAPACPAVTFQPFFAAVAPSYAPAFAVQSYGVGVDAVSRFRLRARFGVGGVGVRIGRRGLLGRGVGVRIRGRRR